MASGIDEIFTIRLLAYPVNAENEDELRRLSHKGDLELRGGGDKAAARRGERSESLDAAEHSSILVM
jgi:hypothetical protein